MYVDTSPSEVAGSSDQHMQRARGAAHVGWTGTDGQLRLNDLYQSSPCKVLMPRVDGRDKAEAVFINTAGGVAGGDQLDYSASVAGNAHALVTTQASEKIYGAIDQDAHLNVQMTAASGATLEWLPQQTIAFNGARLARHTTLDVDSDSRLLALDWLVLGRHAHGEVMTQGSLHDQWRIYRDGRLVWADAFRMAEDLEAQTARMASLNGNLAFALVVYVGADAPDRLEAAKDIAASCNVMAGATCVNGLLVSRFLAPAGPDLQQSVSQYLEQFRRVIGKLPPWPPRVWVS